MLLTANYNLKKPEGTDTVNIDDLNENADIIDGKLKNLYDTKAPKYTATASKDGLMSKTDKAKIDGIELGANAYVHPNSHPANMITEDSTHRFLTDEERKLIQAWETFKASGGDIGGALVTNRVERVIPVNTIEDGYAVALALKSANGLDKLELLLGKDSGKKALYPIQRYGLGTPNFAFSEIWAGNFLKTANGFLQLPNGFILQWGTVDAQHNNNIYYPIAFPNVALVVTASATGTSAASVNVNIAEKNYFKVYVSSAQNIRYIAIGY